MFLHIKSLTLINGSFLSWNPINEEIYICKTSFGNQKLCINRVSLILYTKWLFIRSHDLTNVYSRSFLGFQRIWENLLKRQISKPQYIPQIYFFKCPKRFCYPWLLEDLWSSGHLYLNVLLPPWNVSQPDSLFVYGQNFLIFCGQVVFHCVNLHHFYTLLLMDSWAASTS